MFNMIVNKAVYNADAIYSIIFGAGLALDSLLISAFDYLSTVQTNHGLDITMATTSRTLFKLHQLFTTREIEGTL